ncbi:MAG: hypothetical protein IJ272_06295 [Clostridia bacterium]|nr:hypothetical protein [Clostridia bacterium]
MLKAKLTDNLAGLTISGDHEDLDKLYDAISHLIKGEPNTIQEYTMQNHLYGFLYDVRHAYQGDREIELIDNWVSEDVRKWHGFKKSEITDRNAYFSFNYPLPDILLDMVLIQHFIRKVHKKENDIYNPYINIVNLFYSIALDPLYQVLAPGKFNTIKKGLLESVVPVKSFCPQWFQMITCDYLKWPKDKRLKHLPKIADEIYNFIEYEDYANIKIDTDNYCKKNNCTLDDVTMGEYPTEIIW